MRAVIACATLAVLALGACGGSARRAPGPAPTGTVPGDAGTASVPATATVAVVPPAALAEADRALHEGRFEVAADAYAAVANATADSSLRGQALLGRGIARFESGDGPGAIDDLRNATAAALPGSTVQRRAAYLLGLRLNEGGRYGEAVAALRPFAAASATDALQPYLVAEAAHAAGETGDVASAVAGWEALVAMPSPPPALVERAYRERAQLARTAADSAGALAWIAKLAEVTSDPAARYELAGLAAISGDRVTFATQLQAIISGSPGAKEAVLAIADLREAGYAVDRGQAGLVYYRRGAYVDARAELLKAIEEPGLAAPDLAFRLYYLAAAFEDAGQPQNAIPYYDRAATAAPDSPYAHRARYWAARSVEATGDLASASRRYLALATGGPAGEFTGEAAFRAGYALLRAGDAAGAIQAWDTTRATDARVEYWTGRALQRRNEDVAARAAFERAANLEPWGFYGVEAAREIGRIAPIDVTFHSAVQDVSPDWSGISQWLRTLGIPGEGTDAPVLAADEMLALGQRAAAAAALLDASNGAGPWRLLALARQAHGLGLVDVGARLAVRLRSAVGSPEAGAPVALMRLAYPVGYVTLLNQEALASGLDPLFVAAMVRQESFWDPQAGSRAGALGLTQVIPPTGEGIARALGVQAFKAEDLFRPGVSLRFGAYYLGGQLQRFQQPYAALAAYNAGPRNALRWVDSAPHAGAADFIETIDIAETHDYVERVMDHYAHYVYAYRGSQ